MKQVTTIGLDIAKSGPFIEVQVKALRVSGQTTGYVFMQKSKFALKEHLWLALGLLTEGKSPDLYFIPSRTWETPNAVFASRNYEGFAGARGPRIRGRLRPAA